MTLMRDIATALESAAHAMFVTLSRAGMLARSVHRSMSTRGVARGGRSSGRTMFESASLAREARAHPERAIASMKKYARSFPLLTRAIKDARPRMRKGPEVSHKFVPRGSERAVSYVREEGEPTGRTNTAPHPKSMRCPPGGCEGRSRTT